MGTTNAVTICLGILLSAGMAAADTIYLKNGRIIRTSSATVEGDRVLFTQFGHPIAIPLSEVDRVEEDEYEDPSATPVREAPVAGTAPQTPTSIAPAPGADAAPSPDPEETKECWQSRVRAINSEAVSLDLQMKQLRRVERAFLFSHRSTADTRRQIDDLEARIDANQRALPELRREARRQGVPPGWLRLPRGG